jgi:outer membrane receptor for ferrienterochelin and colicins
MKKLTFLMMLGLSNLAFSQQIVELEPVVVTSTRSEISLENSPVPTEVIGKDEIEKLNLNTMNDLLQQKGYFLAPMKSGGFQLRGLSSEYVLVMIDGVPIAGRESGALDLSNIYLGNVERVEIVKGSMSSLWGNHAIGGVINIITKKNGENSTSISSQYGTNNEHLTGISNTFGKKNFKNVSQLSFGGSDGFDIDPNTYGKNVLPFKQLNLSNRSSWLVNPNDLASLSINYFNKKSEGSTITETNTQGQLVPVDEVNSNQNLIVDFTYNSYLSDRFNSEIKISNSYFDNSNQSTFEYFGQSVVQLDESKQNIFQPEMINTYYWDGKQSTTLGFGYRGYSIETERYNGKRDLNSSFAYIQHYINLNKLNFVIGGRYDNYTEFGANFSPKVSAKYNLNKKVSLNTSVGYGFRAPDFRTLYINYGGYSQGFYVLGAYNIGEQIQSYQSQNLLPVLLYNLNDITNLKSETSISYDFGIDYKLNDKSKVGISVFQTQTNDLIESVLAGVFVNQTLLFGYTNISEATFRGFELDGLYQKGNFRFDGSYQYLETQANKSDGTEFFLGERPKHLVNISTTYTTKSKFTININGVYKSDYFFRDINRNNIQEPTEFVPQHTLLNGIVTKTFGDFVIGLGSNNILNFTNREYLKFQNGRTFFTKLTYKL